MAEVSTIARPYAEAVYRVASESNLEAWAELMGDLAAVAGNPDMQAVIGNPKLSPDQVFDIFTGVLEAPLDTFGQNFVRTLIDNGRLALLPEIAEQFHALKNAGQGTADATIYSAFPMSDAQIASLMATLEKKFKVKLTPTVTVDPSLIGGVRVVVNDEVLDTSIRTRLEQMRTALTA
ncbi:MAG: F0F1 ATP synthase subunit delta [Burkholderiaceae bacterium]|jgi:F-type H+-transporting ATPase subunit delta